MRLIKLQICFDQKGHRRLLEDDVKINSGLGLFGEKKCQFFMVCNISPSLYINLL